ncbi:1-deoxy-D-xylulose-5-phosphate reductoisomerase [bacterium]|nr:1-deoxy-D-xylulose-5-phosphate reductoisomerase [bacterium]
MFDKKRITILGSTGSIGTQALEVVEKLKDKFEIISLTAGNNVELLKSQIRKFHPKSVCVSSVEAQTELHAEFKDLEVLVGDSGLEQICSNRDNDLIVVAVSGKIGLKPTLTAIKNKIDVALANKETLVMAGDIVMAEVRRHGVNLIPIDSEHCAIHQCIKNPHDVSKLIITASGGPFLKKSTEDMKRATIEQALAHPRWKMGKKITVDSATLMNKGLEVIEAHHLFGMNYDDIDVVIHPQSIVHSAIEYVDGSVIAQLGLPSMHIPIQYAVSYPERFEGIKSKSFSFIEAKTLDFEPVDFKKFKLLNIAYEAGKVGYSAPVCMNAANEEAVFAFLNGKIKLYNIVEIVDEFMSKHSIIKVDCVDDIFNLDFEIRTKTKEFIEKIRC